MEEGASFCTKTEITPSRGHHGSTYFKFRFLQRPRVGLLVADKRKKRPTSVSLWGVRRRAGRRHHALRPASVTDLRQ